LPTYPGARGLDVIQTLDAEIEEITVVDLLKAGDANP